MYSALGQKIIYENTNYSKGKAISRSNGKTYISGHYKNKACYWVDNIRYDLTTDNDTEATGIFVEDDSIYISIINRSSGKNYIWNNGNLTKIDDSHFIKKYESAYFAIRIYDIFIENGNIYVCGITFEGKSNSEVHGFYMINDDVYYPEIAASLYSMFVKNGTVYSCCLYLVSSASSRGTYWIDTIKKNLERCNDPSSVNDIIIAEDIYVDENSDIYVCGNKYDDTSSYIWKNGDVLYQFKVEEQPFFSW